MLEISDLSAGYDSKDVVLGVSIDVREGEVVAIIGSNGAGKTTFLKAVCGLLPVSAGEVRYEGRSITDLAIHEIARAGISFVPAGRHLFPEMTVAENLGLGAYPHRPEAGQQSVVFDLFPRLAERRRQAAGTMSGGEQQMLAVARALMARPKMLMLDEPSLGLAPMVVAEIFEIIGTLHEDGVSILLVEQNVQWALTFAHRVVVLDLGTVAFDGDPGAFAESDVIHEAYLGRTSLEERQ